MYDLALTAPANNPALVTTELKVGPKVLGSPPSPKVAVTNEDCCVIWLLIASSRVPAAAITWNWSEVPGARALALRRAARNVVRERVEPETEAAALPKSAEISDDAVAVRPVVTPS